MIFIYIGIAVFLGIIYYYLSIQQGSITRDINKFNPNLEYYSLDDGNQTALVVGLDIKKEWYEKIEKSYKWSSFDEYENRLSKYAEKLFDESVKNCGINDDEDLWRALNRSQKILWSFLIFTGDVDAGGVSHFLFNRPEFTFSVFEMMQELDLKDLEKDYKNIIHELSGKVAPIADLKTSFNESNEDIARRWNDYANGSYDLQSVRVIENYFYKRSFKKTYLKKMADYIEANIDNFAAIY